MTHTVRQRRLVLLISFLLPVLIMGGYFVYRGMAPFSSMSTFLPICAHRFCIIPAACFIPLVRDWAVRCGVPTPTIFGAR